MSRRARSAALVAVVWLAGARDAGATGEHALSTFFDYATHPDFPLEEFAAGHLGVLRPSYRREYLAVAWRYLNGGRLDAAERAGATEVFRSRLRRLGETESRWRAAQARLAAWGRARMLVKDARPSLEIALLRDQASWVDSGTCLPDAFESAGRALRERVARLGADAAELRAWLEAQDLVFANCDPTPIGIAAQGEATPAPAPAIPDPLPPSATAGARADRDYQIAAAHFYQGHFEEAVQRFHRIAADPASPWATLGGYLAARALVRKASQSVPPDVAALTDAERELGNLLDGDAGGHRARAERLLNLVAFRLHPATQVRALARRVERGSGDLRNDLTDFLWLLARAPAGDAGAALDRGTLRAEDEMVDWMLTLEEADPRRQARAASDASEPTEAVEPPDAIEARRAAAFTRALARYHAGRALPWLVAALVSCPPSHPAAAGLIEAAARVAPASPAHETALFHASRLQLESGREERAALARRRLDGLLTGLRAGRPSSTLNRLLALRLRAATSLDDVVDHGQRFVLGTGVEDDDSEVPEEHAAPARRAPAAVLRLDDDGAATLAARLPTAQLARLIDHPRLAEPLRAELLRATLVRALLLDDTAIVRALLPAAQAQNLELPAWREGLAAMASAGSDEERGFAGTVMLLRVWGTRPWVDAGVGRQTALGKQDDFRDNWWCNPREVAAAPSRAARPTAPAAPPLAFLAEADRRAAEAEWQRLIKAGAGPNALAARTIEFARTHPDDARLPEALYLVNRATHFGCRDDRTSHFSKQAYLVLHRGWPRSEWAAKVKYWW